MLLLMTGTPCELDESHIDYYYWDHFFSISGDIIPYKIYPNR